MTARRRGSRENGDRSSVTEAAKAVARCCVVKYIVSLKIRNTCRRYSKMIITAFFN